MYVPNDANTYLPGTIAIPSALEIIGMTNSYPMVVTIVYNAVSQSNSYQFGQLVRITVPIQYGMFQANGLEAKVLANVNDQITLDVDSRQFDVFTLSSIKGITPPSLSPAGARNLTLDNTTRLVPFQSLNDRGN